jgi:hypothetical protein
MFAYVNKWIKKKHSSHKKMWGCWWSGWRCRPWVKAPVLQTNKQKRIKKSFIDWSPVVGWLHSWISEEKGAISFNSLPHKEQVCNGFWFVTLVTAHKPHLVYAPIYSLLNPIVICCFALSAAVSQHVRDMSCCWSFFISKFI